jgi:hypothetical protein
MYQKECLQKPFFSEGTHARAGLRDVLQEFDN